MKSLIIDNIICICLGAIFYSWKIYQAHQKISILNKSIKDKDDLISALKITNYQFYRKLDKHEEQCYLVSDALPKQE